MKGLAILGATGSIGVNTLDVAARHPDKYRIIALSANTQYERMAQQCRQHQPLYAVMSDSNAAEKLHALIHKELPDIRILSGQSGLCEAAAAPEVDYVMAAIVGAAGLASTLAAARAGKRILLANKESLVMSGRLFMDEVRKNNAELLPIDSEHNAIFQCMPHDYHIGQQASGVKRILLTGSGGPFRQTPLSDFDRLTPEQAVSHPNWTMGRKISVDSATMMNKGLEVIEACWLFNTELDNIKVVLHPQSVIHSMVEYHDGSVLAQLGQPDMRTPIAHALAWPQRISSGVESLDFFSVDKFEFEQVDDVRYPCLFLAQQAMRRGGSASTILNAANEVAVQAFLDEQIPFPAIAKIVEQTLTEVSITNPASIDEIVAEDQTARHYAREAVAKIHTKKNIGALG